MKAIAYLQKIGAISPFDAWNLKMSIVVIADELFMEEATSGIDLSIADLSPGDKFDSSLLEKWPSLIRSATSSDLINLSKVLETIDETSFLVRLIEKLLDLRLFYFSQEVGSDPKRCLKDEKWFTKLYNDFVGLKPQQQFKSKSEIIQFYCSGAITVIGEKALADRKIGMNRKG